MRRVHRYQILNTINIWMIAQSDMPHPVVSTLPERWQAACDRDGTLASGTA